MTQLMSSKRKSIARKFYEYLKKFNTRVTLQKKGERYYIIYEGQGG